MDGNNFTYKFTYKSFLSIQEMTVFIYAKVNTCRGFQREGYPQIGATVMSSYYDRSIQGWLAV